MVRSLLIFIILGVVSVTARGQESLCKTSKDTRGRIITTCDEYPVTGLVPGMASTHKQVTYLGSPYLTYPIWQTGSIRTVESGKDLYGELAFDLVNSHVMCRFNGDPKIIYLTPPSFVLNGLEFVRQSDSQLGADHQLYATVVHKGQTKLLKSMSNRLIIYGASNGYEKEEEFNGVYYTAIYYHIRKGNERPQVVELTKKSVLRALPEQAKKIAAILPAGRLTIAEVGKALALYDSLMAEASISQPTPEL